MDQARDDHLAWFGMLVLPTIALYLLSAGPDPIHRLFQVFWAVCLVLLSHGGVTRYGRMTGLAAATVGLLVVGASWASPVLPIVLTLMAVLSRSLATKYP